MIKEWDLVRVVASLSIVLLHSTSNLGRVNGHIEHDSYQFLRVLLTSSTAMFVLLSIIIVSYIYKDRLPNNFIRKRINYILLPFFFFSLVYAFYNTVTLDNTFFIENILKNFKGGFVGWFILPIFQLYLLFWLLKKTKLDKNFFILILMSVGFFYLWAIHGDQSRGFFIDLRIHTLFPTWLLYFGIAYFIGNYYNKFSKLLEKKWSFLIISALFLSTIILIKYNFDNGMRSAYSRRIDLVPYVTMFSILLMYIGKKIPNLFIIRYLSKYAFGIYLTHILIQKLFLSFFADLNNIYLQIGGLFLASVIFSIVILNLISLIPFSKFMVGNIKPNPSLLNLIVDKFSLLFKDKTHSQI